MEDSDIILEYLMGRRGAMPFYDKSEPDDIRRVFKMSKASFKRALGRLMKRGKSLSRRWMDLFKRRHRFKRISLIIHQDIREASVEHMNILKNEQVSIKLKNLGIMIIGVFLYVLAMNMFISPANLYTGGVTGIAQLIIAFASSAFGIQLSLGGLIFLLNVPLLYLAWRSIGKRFAVLSILTVVLQSIILELVPMGKFSDDILLNAVCWWGVNRCWCRNDFKNWCINWGNRYCLTIHLNEV